MPRARFVGTFSLAHEAAVAAVTMLAAYSTFYPAFAGTATATAAASYGKENVLCLPNK